MEPVLIIEDDKSLQEIYTISFQNAGIPITIIDGGLEAMAKIRRVNPPLILLDLLMPGDITGIQFLKMLTSGEKLKYPVMICSNLSSRETIAECKALGVVDYIIKANTDVSTIVSKVKRFLEENKKEVPKESEVAAQ